MSFKYEPSSEPLHISANLVASLTGRKPAAPPQPSNLHPRSPVEAVGKVWATFETLELRGRLTPRNHASLLLLFFFFFFFFTLVTGPRRTLSLKLSDILGP